MLARRRTRAGRPPARACSGPRSERSARRESGLRGPDRASFPGVPLYRLPPRQDSLPPRVAETEHQDEDERAHANQAADEQVAEDDRPQIEEDDLDVEGDEEQRVDVERDCGSPPRVAERVDATLIRHALLAGAAGAGGDQPSQAACHAEKTG